MCYKMKISKLKIGILFFILSILLIETISLAISNNQEEIINKTNTETESKAYIVDEKKPKLSEEEEETLKLINEYRKQNGLEELKTYSKLQKTARIKALDIVKVGYFSHNSPILGTPFELMDKTGIYYNVAGENLAGNISPEKAVKAWINSPAHRENILDKEYTYTGIAVMDSPVYGKVFVQMFIGI